MSAGDDGEALRAMVDAIREILGLEPLYAPSGLRRSQEIQDIERFSVPVQREPLAGCFFGRASMDGRVARSKVWA